MFMGMNRCTAYKQQRIYRVPHVHGDEPTTDKLLKWTDFEFPMFMGMNRTPDILSAVIS